MRKLLVFISLVAASFTLKAQVLIYPVTSMEYIFSVSDVEANLDGGTANINTNMRFTAFFNIEQTWHFDFSDKFGLYTGLAFNNVGLIIDDYRYNDMVSIDYDKVKRRSYNMGLPLSFKFGNFSKNIYLFAGGEIELLFHYKEKYWLNDTKYKSKEWFSKKTERWAPSVFAGIQLPGGMFVKYKYYFNDFLNHDYVDPVYDFTSLKKSKIWYISVGWKFRTLRAKKIMEREYYHTAMK